MNAAALGAVGLRGNPDRRATSRYPLTETVRYRLLQGKGGSVSGTGRTLNMASGGILFTTEGKLPVGRTIEVSVNWPARLDGTCPLQFVAVGRVVRSETDRAAVRVERYQFRTRAANGLSPVPSA